MERAGCYRERAAGALDIEAEGDGPQVDGGASSFRALRAETSPWRFWRAAPHRQCITDAKARNETH